ncbi:MAG: methylated-DNA--[protein]-cysteine S-methyltransferase [Planctomycetes bacterium]|nr:methylated-DNA--[protein]-cysteine S-methyltransferase [Planctomycetota bacterium]
MKKYSSVGTAIGTLYAAATQRGICSISLCTSEREFLKGNPGVVRDDAALSGTLDLLRRYVANEDVCLASVNIDISAGTQLQQAVWRRLRRIPKGATVSYKDLAGMVGRPRAARPVGNIVGQNPLLIVVPCHRVIRADGTLGGFGSGTDVKKYLLETVENVSIRE